jgi:hypothetical protein
MAAGKKKAPVKKGNNFGLKKSKKSWAQMDLSERKRARTEYGQWQRSEDGRQGGKYHGVKPPKGWTAKTDKSAMTAAPAKKKLTAGPKKATVTKANYAPPSNSSTAAKKDSVSPPKSGTVKPIGNYASAGGVGSTKSWTIYDYKNDKGRGTKKQTYTRAPSNMIELRAWWSEQKQSAKYPRANSGIIRKNNPPVTKAAMKRIAMKTWPKANWDWIK